MYTGQNKEDKVLSEFFGQYVGTLLSIGENNGQDLSNVLHFLDKGWGGDLVECSPQVFPSLSNLHQYNNKVFCHEVAIGNKNGRVVLYDSGELLGTGDRALVSSTDFNETKRWASLNMPFNEVEVDMVTFDTFLTEHAHYKKFDLISVDAEGMDIIILRQMELDQLGCKALVIEHNSIPANVAIIREYTRPFGFKEIGYNQENIILSHE